MFLNTLVFWKTDPPQEPDEANRKDMTVVPDRVWVVSISPEPYWDKSYLPIYYEDLSFSGTKVELSMVEKLDGKPTIIVKSHVYSAERNGREYGDLLHTYEWKVLDIGGAGGHTNPDELDQLFKKTDRWNPWHWGAKHNNRLERGTKVYMIGGQYEGQHGMIIGNFADFNLTAHPLTVINVQVFLATGKVEEVRQDHLKLVDFHRQLPFGIPKPIGWGEENSSGWGKSHMKRAHNQKQFKPQQDFHSS